MDGPKQARLLLILDAEELVKSTGLWTSASGFSRCAAYPHAFSPRNLVSPADLKDQIREDEMPTLADWDKWVSRRISDGAYGW